MSSARSARAERIFASAAGVALNMSFTGDLDIVSDRGPRSSSRESEEVALAITNITTRSKKQEFAINVGGMKSR